MSENTIAPKKRRWYNNLLDAYTMTRRVYPLVGWILGGVALAILVPMVIVGILTDHWIYLPIMGVLTAVMVPTVILTVLSRNAMYALLEGHKGAAYQVLTQVKRGWIIEQMPAAVNGSQDIVWRIIGRCGVVLIGEGPASRTRRMLVDEAKKVNRVAPNVPVHQVQCGTEDGQVRLKKLMKTINKFKSVLTKHEVPAVANRLKSLQSKSLPIPKGIDPSKVKMNRRSLRGN